MFIQNTRFLETTRRSLRLPHLLSVVILAFSGCSSPAVAQAPVEVAPVEAAPVEAAPAKVAPLDLKNVPTDNPEEIVRFLQRIGNAPLDPRDRAKLKAQVTAISKAQVAAADHLIKAKPTTEQTTFAYRELLLALERLEELGDQQAGKRLPREVGIAKNHKLQGVISLGWQFQFMQQLNRWTQFDTEEKDAFVNDTITEMQAAGLLPIHVDLLQLTASDLEQIEPAYAGKLLQRALPLMQQSDNPRIREFSQRLEPRIRRLTLVGNEMKVFGKLLSTGQEIDWKSYRGKVVLIDFWATWCTACRAEVPNIRELYAKYHDQGFEVVGVSLDDTGQQATDYAKQVGLQWDSLFPADPATRGFNHPLARYYGIDAIPTAILVGRDGKVIHLEAHGTTLQRLLSEQFDKPADKPAATPKRHTATRPIAQDKPRTTADSPQ